MLKNKAETKLQLEADEIFEAQVQVDQLIKDYIGKLLVSKEDAQCHAKTLSAIIDSISDVLIVYDKDENVVLANRAAIEFVAPAPILTKRSEIFVQYEFFKSDGITLIPNEEMPFSLVKEAKRPFTIETLVKG